MKEVIRNAVREYKDARFDILEEIYNIDEEVEFQKLHSKIFCKLNNEVKADFRRLIHLIHEYEKKKFELEKEDLLCLGIKIGASLNDYAPKN